MIDIKVSIIDQEEAVLVTIYFVQPARPLARKVI